jgi:hypothetical protein
MKNRLLPLLICLLLTSVLVFAIKDFVREVIIKPLLYAGWFIGLVLDSLPEMVLWAAFILLAFFIASKSLTISKKTSVKEELKQAPKHGSVITWFRLLEWGQKQDYSRWRLAAELRKLSAKLLLPDKEPSPYDPALRAKLPPEIMAYFDARPVSGGSRLLPQACPDEGRNWGGLGGGSLPFRREAKNETSALNLAPEVVVQFLEKQILS